MSSSQEVRALWANEWAGEPADVYFGAAYGQASLAPGERWCMLAREDIGWQLPLVLRPLGGGLHDAASPYGYAGVTMTRGTPAAAAEDAWNQSLDTLSRMGVVSVFLRRSPLVDQAPRHPREVAVGGPRHTTALDLSHGQDALWASFRGSVRTAVRKAQTTGHTCAIAAATPADLTTGSPFRCLYEATMDKNAASGSYYFSDDYYRQLNHGLGESLLLGRVLDSGGKWVAAALFMKSGQLMHYHLAGSDRVAARNGVNNLLLWEAAAWGADHGLNTFHLGGGVHEADSLWKFKSAFHGSQLVFQPSGLIVDPDRYDRLVDRQKARLDANDELDPDYFPLYRAPTRELHASTI